MSKEIENIICVECESKYKLVYDLTDTSGFAKLCPFCGGEVNSEEYSDEDETEH